MTETTLLEHIVGRLIARNYCLESGYSEWYNRHSEALANMQKQLPSGSGIDTGTMIDFPESEKRPDRKIVLYFGYHHMDEHGMYDGWTEHKVIVMPSLLNRFDLRITGPNRNQIKDYLYDIFDCALREKYVFSPAGFEVVKSE